MKAPGKDADSRLWSIVTATVRPLPGRLKARPPTQLVALSPPPSPQGPPAATPLAHKAPAQKVAKGTSPAPPGGRGLQAPQGIEPRYRRRLERSREPLAASVDLHGLNQDQARALLTGFILRGWAENRRTILVITGKGALGDGMLRRRVPEWLAEPPLRKLVAGLSEAHRRNGGEGALYVALKRAEAR